MSHGIEKELHEQLEQLPAAQQREVLDFARTLAARRPGATGRALSAFAGTIAKEDLALMAEAIEDSCEQVNPDEW